MLVEISKWSGSKSSLTRLSLTDLKRWVCSIHDSVMDYCLYLNTLTLISRCSFLFFSAFVAAHTRSHLQGVGFRGKAAVGSGSLERDDRGGGGWLDLTLLWKGPLRRMICHNPPGILIVNTAKLLAGISTGMSAAGTPGLAFDLRDFITNWNFIKRF